MELVSTVVRRSNWSGMCFGLILLNLYVGGTDGVNRFVLL